MRLWTRLLQATCKHEYMRTSTSNENVLMCRKCGKMVHALPKGAVISIDAESNGWGRWTGTGLWMSLAYLKK